MANEITASASLAFAKAGVTYPTNGTVDSEGDSYTNEQSTVTGSTFVKETVSVGTSAQALNIAPITANSNTPGWAWFENLDPTNYIQIQNGSGGSAFLNLQPGDPPSLCRLDPACVPYAKANSAACLLKYLIISS